MDAANEYRANLPLSMRARNILRELNVSCEEELMALNKQKISRIRGGGFHTVREILTYQDTLKNTDMQELIDTLNKIMATRKGHRLSVAWNGELFLVKQ